MSASALPTGWIVTTDWVARRRHVQPGTELSIIGVSGRFRFVRHVRTATAEWIDVVGGTKAGGDRTRSFRPERVRAVHRIARMRQPS